jgi:RNA polymerase sigma factor (sigma-70 family)
MSVKPIPRRRGDDPHQDLSRYVNAAATKASRKRRLPPRARCPIYDGIMKEVGFWALQADRPDLVATLVEGLNNADHATEDVAIFRAKIDSVADAVAEDLDRHEQCNPEAVQAIPAKGPSPLGFLLEAELESAFIEAFERLPDRRRLVLAAHLEGVKVDKIAELYDISRATVYQEMADAKKSLRRELRDYE